MGSRVRISCLVRNWKKERMDDTLRRLLLPADVTLAQLHDVLQTTMGWDDGHMHEFSVGQRRFGRPDAERTPAD